MYTRHYLTNKKIFIITSSLLFTPELKASSSALNKTVTLPCKFGMVKYCIFIICVV